jgi:hypothetical protein
MFFFKKPTNIFGWTDVQEYHIHIRSYDKLATAFYSNTKLYLLHVMFAKCKMWNANEYVATIEFDTDYVWVKVRTS